MRLGHRLFACAAGLTLAGGAVIAAGGHVHAAPTPVGCALAGPSEIPANPAIGPSCTYTTATGAENAVVSPGMAINVSWKVGSTTFNVFVNPACATSALPNPDPSQASANCPPGTVSADPAAITIPTSTLVTVTEGNAGQVGPAGGGGVGPAVVGENPAG